MNDNTESPFVFEETDSPFVLEEPAWLKEAPKVRKARSILPIGDELLPGIDDAVDDLSNALVALQDTIKARVEAGCSLDTARRLLAAHGWLECQEPGIEQLRGILYDPRTVVVIMPELDPPF